MEKKSNDVHLWGLTLNLGKIYIHETHLRQRASSLWPLSSKTCIIMTVRLKTASSVSSVWLSHTAETQHYLL